MNKIKALIELKEPYIHLIITDKTQFKRLYTVYANAEDTNSVVNFIEGSKCDTKNTLFNEFVRELEFPEYFGCN